MTTRNYNTLMSRLASIVIESLYMQYTNFYKTKQCLGETYTTRAMKHRSSFSVGLLKQITAILLKTILQNTAKSTIIHQKG